MSGTTMTKPDLEFVRELKAAGGENVKKCFQCATCSVACKLSPDDRPYPRKEMIWAQWGQREKLVTDPDLWLCHQCNDCSTRCPRGARPGDVLAALRSFAVQHYSFPSFMGKLVQDPKWVLAALGLPLLLILAVHWFINGGFVFAPKHEIHFSEFFPHMWMNITFSAFTTMAFLSAVMGLARFWKDMSKHRPGAARETIVTAAIATFTELVLHGKFRQCGASKSRWWIHMLIFYGFVGLFIVTGIVVVMLVIAPDSYPINSLVHPLKLAGNICGAALLLGCMAAVYNRLTNPDEAGRSSYFDWFFLLVLFGVGATGILTEVTRFADIRAAAYPVYLAHLVFIFSLLVYLPYSKFAHMLYRFTALTYARHIGLAAASPTAVATVPPAPAAAEPEHVTEDPAPADEPPPAA